MPSSQVPKDESRAGTPIQPESLDYVVPRSTLNWTSSGPDDSLLNELKSIEACLGRPWAKVPILRAGLSDVPTPEARRRPWRSTEGEMGHRRMPRGPGEDSTGVHGERATSFDTVADPESMRTAPCLTLRRGAALTPACDWPAVRARRDEVLVAPTKIRRRTTTPERRAMSGTGGCSSAVCLSPGRRGLRSADPGHGPCPHPPAQRQKLCPDFEGYARVLTWAGAERSSGLWSKSTCEKVRRHREAGGGWGLASATRIGEALLRAPQALRLPVGRTTTSRWRS